MYWLVLMVAALSGGCDPSDECCEDARPVTAEHHVGRYINAEYGFSVEIPAGYVAFNSPAPAPDHGIGLLVAESPRAYAYVIANYELPESAYEAGEQAATHSGAQADRPRRIRLAPIGAERAGRRY